MSAAGDARAAAHQAWLRHLRSERGYSPQTLKAYGEDLQQLAQALHRQQLDETQVREADIRRLVALAARQGLSPRSQARRLSCWRGYFDWLALQGQVKANPARGVKAPKAPKRLPKALAPDQAMRLADHQALNSFESLRDKAAVELLYSSGLRVSELASLDRQYLEASLPDGGKYRSLSWWDAGQQQVTVTGKGRKMRTVPVGGAAMQALRDWLAFRDQWAAQQPAGAGQSPESGRGGASGPPAGAASPSDHAALFISQRGRRLSVRSFQARLGQLGVREGLSSRVHPHVLRHSFASHVLQSSGDLRAVQEMLGHSNIASTQIYTSLDFQRLAAVYDAAHPRARKP